jgi:predicted CoA-binding protein
MPDHPPVCNLRAGGVSANSPVQSSEFATTPYERYRILERYSSVAMVGLSSNPYRPSHFAAMYLLAEGFNVIPVNPGEAEILGRKCYAGLKDIPEAVEIVDIFRPPEVVPPIVEEAIAIGARVVWMQFEVIHYEAARRARDAGLEVVMDHCMKVEHARFFGALHILGLNTGVVSSRAWNPKARPRALPSPLL